jgi:hypothetical protein
MTLLKILFVLLFFVHLSFTVKAKFNDSEVNKITKLNKVVNNFRKEAPISMHSGNLNLDKLNTKGKVNETHVKPLKSNTNEIGSKDELKKNRTVDNHVFKIDVVEIKPNKIDISKEQHISKSLDHKDHKNESVFDVIKTMKKESKEEKTKEIKYKNVEIKQTPKTTILKPILKTNNQTVSIHKVKTNENIFQEKKLEVTNIPSKIHSDNVKDSIKIDKSKINDNIKEKLFLNNQETKKESNNTNTNNENQEEKKDFLIQTKIFFINAYEKTSTKVSEYYHKIKKESNIILNKTYKAVDPYVNLYYVQIILGLLTLGLLLIVFNKIFKTKKADFEKSKNPNAKNCKYYYKSNAADQVTDDEDNEKIILTGRKNKKPKLEVDYSSFFNNPNTGEKIDFNAKRKQKDEEIMIEKKGQNDVNTPNNPLYEFSNKCADEEKFKNHYYTNNYTKNYCENNPKQNTNPQNDLNTSKASYYENNGFNEIYYVTIDGDNKQANTNNDNNNNLNSQNQKINNDIDMYELFGKEKKEIKNEKPLTEFTFSNTTSNIEFQNSEQKRTQIIENIDQLQQNKNNQSQTNSVDDFMDFFSNVPQNTSNIQQQNDLIEDNKLSEFKKNVNELIEKNSTSKTNIDTTDDKTNDNKEKENSSSRKSTEDELKDIFKNFKISTSFDNEETSFQSENKNEEDVIDKTDKKLTKERKLKKEFQPVLENIPEEVDLRKESEEFDYQSQSNIEDYSSSLLTNSNQENSTEYLNDEDKVIKKLKKMKLKRCMIK